MENENEKIETPEAETTAPETTNEAPEASVPAKELDALKQDFEAQLAEKDRQYAEMKADYEAKFAAMKDAADAQHAEAEMLGKLAEESALAGKTVAEENEQLKARIAELEANAKTAEQIAAEKYGIGISAKPETGAVDLDTLKAQWNELKAERGPKLQAWIRGLSEAEYKALFGN